MGRIIGITGHAGAGKDTAADILATWLDAQKLALADPLKRFCREVYDFTEEQLWGPSAKRNEPDPRYRRVDGSCLTPREALQTLGTEWGRRCYEDTWIDLGVRRAQEIAVARHAIITDVRFPNEFIKIRCAGGLLLRIRRPGCGGAVGLAGHASEAAQDDIPDATFDAVILNEGTLGDLQRRLLDACEALGLG